MAAKEDRIDALRELVAVNEFELDGLAGLQRLDEWFVASVEPSESDPSRLRNIWYSVVNDIGLHLGELVIAAADGQLRWEFVTRGARNVAYQRHVIVGFRVPNPNYNHDFDLAVGFYGHRIIAGNDRGEGLFVRAAQIAIDLA